MPASRGSQILIPSSHNTRKSLTLLCLAACWSIGVLLAGCAFKPPTKPPVVKPPIEYPILSLPQSVLKTLELAYEARDSVKYKEIYDSTYTGQSTDTNDNQGPIDVTYRDELDHIGRIASAPGITTYLELGPDASWDRLESDDPSHPDWTRILISGNAYTVQVTEGTTTYEAKGETGTFQEFAFDFTLDSTSPTDTLWKIVRWREIGKSGDPEGIGSP
jgi:hypothetical protein